MASAFEDSLEKELEKSRREIGLGEVGWMRPY